MAEKKSADYRDYFIVDGRHVGDYEGMYLNAEDPWSIEKLGVRLDMRAALLLLDSLPEPPARALDLGAGAGLFSLEIWRALLKRNPGASLVLSDVSPAALALAETRFRREIQAW